MKMNLTTGLAIVLYAGMFSASVVQGYDGDVDYSAPYVTLDPETGKLITVDPRQEQAAAAAAQQHAATATDSTASTPAIPANTDMVTTTAVPTSAGSGPEQQTAAPGTTVFAAIAGIVLIGVIVAMTRKKPTPDTDNDSTS